ncbi:probable serine carboxypeptidase CPVL isoform X1 [Rhipicephalus sanguineus]|uniref:probable serine carboxypeptidase CPVL isoform X1 n=1 Tax=Rhipicephalus sanguineus TaxID=34632 RepID=UPI0020C1C2C0|nr:probable serine carboxypeptidase CPVL isoform X1 [Rhipicephalus sanguineus]
MALAGVPCITTAILVWALTIAACRCCDSEAKRSKPPCPTFRKKDKHSEDLLLHPTNDHISKESLDKMRQASRVCLPCPGRNIEAYSGFIPVDSGEDESYSSYLFFLHIKSEKNANKKPLLLWLQGGPGKSALYGQFLENGPLGMTVLGTLYKRRHTLLKQFNIIYLDQPVGAGYSFDRHEKYPSSLEEVSVHLMRFMRRFLRIFHEYKGRDFYVAGESYGARSAVGLAQRVLTRKPDEFPLRLKGVMLGVGFVFPLLEMINSADYLYCSSLLDEQGRDKFSQRFEAIQYLVKAHNYTAAAGLLSHTVLNMHPGGHKSLFEALTGFESHGSIIRPVASIQHYKYIKYADSPGFKRIIHVDTSRTLDGTRTQLVMRLAVGDFFVDLTPALVDVLNNVRVLFYTAQLDAVFPATKMERLFSNLNWRGAGMFRKAARHPWYKSGTRNKLLLGYEKVAGTLMYNTVLFGGHMISFDQPAAVVDLYARFLKFASMPAPNVPDHKCDGQKGRC